MYFIHLFISQLSPAASHTHIVSCLSGAWHLWWRPPLWTTEKFARWASCATWICAAKPSDMAARERTTATLLTPLSSLKPGRCRETQVQYVDTYCFLYLSYKTGLCSNDTLILDQCVDQCVITENKEHLKYEIPTGCYLYIWFKMKSTIYTVQAGWLIGHYVLT